jgi:methyltransferase (TIGR00027 family)
MQRSHPSLTAHRVAIRRAAHQLFDEPKVFQDSLAVGIIGAEALVALRKEQPIAGDPEARSLRAFMSVRSRYAEDQLAVAVTRGVRQYVVLGAGLDTFAYRNPYGPVGLRVFEVDHPATQAWKRDLLAAAGISIPSTMVFVSVDFERDQLADRLRSAGFDAAQPAFFCWLGVTIYLTPEAFASMLSFVRAMPAGSGIVLDYAVARSSLTPLERKKLATLTKRVGAAGEPFRLFFEPQRIAAQFTQLGFTQLEDLGQSAMNTRYFANRADGLQVTNGIGRLLSAWAPAS